MSQSPRRDDTAELDRARSALSACNPNCTRDEWVRIATAAKAAGIDGSTFHEWSAAGDSYRERDATALWRSLKRDGGITEATLFKIATDSGWKPPANDVPHPPGRRTRTKAAALWERYEPATHDHPYIVAKQGRPEGLRVVPADDPMVIHGHAIAGWLVVPVIPLSGSLPVSLQYIPPPGAGQKMNLPGADIAGVFVVGELAPGCTVYVCEGIGAAWACWRASGAASVVCFGSGLMNKIAAELRQRDPSAQLVIVADVGKEADAEQIAGRVRGRFVTMPDGWADNDDVNDYALKEGIERLELLLAGARESEAASDMPVPIDLLELAKSEPEPPNFIWSNWLQEGEVALLAGHGGKGKSIIMLFILVCIALGRTLWGLAVQRRRVAIFSFEDDKKTLHWRLSRICALLGVRITDLNGWLLLFDGTDADAVMFADTPRDGPHITTTYMWVRDTITTHKIEVTAIDGASDVYMASENNRALVKRFIRLLRRLIPRNGAVILLAHVNRPTAAAGKTTEGYSGSTQWHNAVRNRWYLRSEAANDDDDSDTPDSGIRILELQKANNAQAGDKIELRWNESAKCFVSNALPQPSKMQRDLRDVELRDWLIERIRRAEAAGDPVPSATSGTRNSHNVLAAVEGFPSDFRIKGGRKRFWAMIEKLRSDHRIFEDTMWNAHRNRVGVFRMRTDEPST